MSQSEVIKILVKMGGSATIDELAYEYNKEHFPRNTHFQEQEMVVVKKTMQNDTRKLLRDNIIKKEKKRKARGQFDKFTNKPTITYTFTEYGKHRLQTLQPLQIV